MMAGNRAVCLVWTGSNYGQGPARRDATWVNRVVQQQLHGLVALLFVFLSTQLAVMDGVQAEVTNSTDNDVGNMSTSGTSLPASHITTTSPTQNVTTLDGHPETNNTGTVVAVILICALLFMAIIVAVYFFRRKRQFRMMDKEKKMQMQMSSARNAGIYQDLTVSVPGDEKPPATPEHERLKAAEDI